LTGRSHIVKHAKAILLAICLLVQAKALFAVNKPVYNLSDYFQRDTIPEKKDSIAKTRSAFSKYYNLMMKKQSRDSIMKKLSREDQLAGIPDSVAFQKQQRSFARYKGRVIRDIYYNRVKVFGPNDIYDTSFSTKSKLIRFANGLHFNTREWAIRQALFVKENDSLNAFKLADNERYLRNLSFITDARIYVINALKSEDSVDLLVVTKDQFEYGGRLSRLSPNTFAASIYNDNLLGAAQNVLVGFSWNKDYSPEWLSEIRYTKYNFAGSFTDISVGYSSLNNQNPIDTSVYERSYYLNIDRPLYSSWAKFTGGISLASNSSINIRNLDDTVYRNYAYNISDVWVGYNFRNQFRKDGRVSSRPNMAITARTYRQEFTRTPTQEMVAKDPVYNDHRYTLGSFVLFKQEFFKANHFFGFGRTEDIPSGYNASITLGSEKWFTRKRVYSAIDLQKFWLFTNGGLLNTQFAAGSFWKDETAEDDVIDINIEYFSPLMHLKERRFRQFIGGDYIVSSNPVFLRPININRDAAIFGYRNSMLSGYQRLTFKSETYYYSPLKFVGFKFNFFASLQAALLTDKRESILKSPLYSGIGLGCNIRNENLSLNTIQFSANYLPAAPPDVKPFFLSISTIIDLRFNIYALNAPRLIPFR
jgi:hypothetical protein